MKNSEYPKFSELSVTNPVCRPFYVRKMDDAVGNNGKPYVTLTLYDGFSVMKCNCFDKTVRMMNEEGVNEKGIYVCKFTKNDRGYTNIESGIKANIDPDIKVSDFGQRIEQDPEELFASLIKGLKAVRDTRFGEDTLSDLAVKLLTDNHDEFVRSSAAISMHHEQEGGLVLHSHSVTNAAYHLSKVYKKLDVELLVCGAALHDIGKIKEYVTDELGFATFSPLGQGLGHSVYGIEMVEQEAKKGNYNEERVMLLKHIIASHHGELEYGAIAKPAIPEAVLIHCLDDADAKLNMFEKIYKDLAPGQNTEKSMFGLDTKAYKPSFLE